MTRMTGPDCAVMCISINTHTHTEREKERENVFLQTHTNIDSHYILRLDRRCRVDKMYVHYVLYVFVIKPIWLL